MGPLAKYKQNNSVSIYKKMLQQKSFEGVFRAFSCKKANSIWSLFNAGVDMSRHCSMSILESGEKPIIGLSYSILINGK